MSKKKKKNKGILAPIDAHLNVTYDSLVDEIQTIQRSIAYYEQRELRKAKKKLKKNPNMVINVNKIKGDARLRAVHQLESSDTIDRVEKSLKDFSSTCIILARCVAALVVCILSIDYVKTHISGGMLEKLSKIYELAIKFK